MKHIDVVLPFAGKGFLLLGVVWAVFCVALTWWRYARPGAPKKS